MPDAQGVNGPEVPGSPQPQAEVTRVTWIVRGQTDLLSHLGASRED